MAGKIAGGVAVTIFTEGSANPRCFVKTARSASPQPPGQGCHFTPVIPRNTLQRSASPSDIKSLTSNFYGLTPLALEAISILIVRKSGVFIRRFSIRGCLVKSRILRGGSNRAIFAKLHWLISITSPQRVIEIFRGEHFARRTKDGKVALDVFSSWNCYIRISLTFQTSIEG